MEQKPAYTEDHLVEQPAIALLRGRLGWEAGNCFDEWAKGSDPLIINLGEVADRLRSTNADEVLAWVSGDEGIW